MPSIHLDPTKKGLVQKTGSVVSGDTAAVVAKQAVTGNGVTIKTVDKGMLVRIDVNGGNHTGAILEKKYAFK